MISDAKSKIPKNDGRSTLIALICEDFYLI
jgi:hypothetical protein